MTQRGATILHGLPLLSFMCLLLSTRRLRSLRHIIRYCLPSRSGQRRATSAHLFLRPYLLPFPSFFPSFPSPCTPPCSSPFSPTLLPSPYSPPPFSSPCSSPTLLSSPCSLLLAPPTGRLRHRRPGPVPGGACRPQQPSPSLRRLSTDMGCNTSLLPTQPAQGNEQHR